MGESSAERILAVIATYNERENVAALLDAIFAQLPRAEALVVDDGSPDGTGAIVEEYRRRDGRVHVIHRSGKLGLGSAILTAMRFAIDNGYDFLLTMDADFSHPPDKLPALLAGMADHDVMIGSRYVRGGKISGWGIGRIVMSRAINLYTRALLRVPAKDCSGGFRCYRVAKLARIDFSRVYSTGYSFLEELLFHCHQVGCRIGEVPIHFENRLLGTSKMSLRESLRALWALFFVSIRR